MSVYVDEPMLWGWKYGKSCHLFADTLEELHTFAISLGMKREWFQDGHSLPHYDLTEKRREVAVKNGAIEINKYQVVGVG